MAYQDPKFDWKQVGSHLGRAVFATPEGRYRVPSMKQKDKTFASVDEAKDAIDKHGPKASQTGARGGKYYVSASGRKVYMPTHKFTK